MGDDETRPAAALHGSRADREATVRSEVLDSLAAHGGERLVAGPPMERLVDELTAKIMGWLG